VGVIDSILILGNITPNKMKQMEWKIYRYPSPRRRRRAAGQAADDYLTLRKVAQGGHLKKCTCIGINVSVSPNRSMPCGAKCAAKLPGYELICLVCHRGRKIHLYCETECVEQIYNYYRLHTARFGHVRLGRRVNFKFRESVHISPHIGAHLGFLWPILSTLFSALRCSSTRKCSRML
jgi:hypothetical protein